MEYVCFNSNRIIFFYYKGPFTNILSKVKEDQGTFSRTLLTTPRPGGTSSHQLLPWTGNNFWSSVRGGGDNRESWTSLWPSRVCDRSVTEELCMCHGIVNQANNILQDSQWQLLPWSLDYQEAEQNPRIPKWARVGRLVQPSCSSWLQTSIPKDCLLPVTAINTELLNVEFGQQMSLYQCPSHHLIFYVLKPMHCE